jgi:hypothetical protein
MARDRGRDNPARAKRQRTDVWQFVEKGLDVADY